MTRSLLTLLFALTLLLPPAAPAVTLDEQCFIAETGHCIRGRFLAYWRGGAAGSGGLARNGYPLTDEIVEVLEDGHPYTVQYFERVRMEYHPEIVDPDRQILLGQFGRLIYPADPPADPDPALIWFPQTGHNVSATFYRYWAMHGGMEQFGLPLSEAFRQRLDDGQEYTVQYFERARFEYHPENMGTAYDILLGQLGRLVLMQRQP